jgi:hypothetical protein
MKSADPIDEFVKRICEAGGGNIKSVILFGSAVAGDFHPGLSNLNTLCVLGDSSFGALHALTPVAKWWYGKKQPPPLCLTRLELERSTDVFTIELLDMQQYHRVLFGEDALRDLSIPMHLHRVQVEYELREKLFLLRQHVLVASDNESRLWDVLAGSAASFGTLFRHSLIALGDTAQPGKRAAVGALATRIGFDPSAALQVLDAREHTLDRKKVDVRDLASRYLATVEKVTAAVDAAFDQK